MDTYWIPGVNRLGSFGRWAFAEFTDVYALGDRLEAEITALVNEVIAQAAGSERHCGGCWDRRRYWWITRDTIPASAPWQYALLPRCARPQRGDHERGRSLGASISRVRIRHSTAPNE